MPELYWLVHPNGTRQRIDPRRFDLAWIAGRAAALGAELVVERRADPLPVADAPPRRFEPPPSALGPLFRLRLARVIACRVAFHLDLNARPTRRMLGGYYHTRRLVRVYTHDRLDGRRPLEELFDTFLHEVAHHLEYTEPDTFRAAACGRVRGRMHSALFWRILGDLKKRWADLRAG